MSSGATRRSILAPLLDRVHDGAAVDQGIALEIHLGDQPLSEGMAEDREMDMHRPPVIGAVRPGIGAGADGQELVAPLRIGQRPPAAAEIRVERGEIGVLHVAIAPARIGLPDLDQRLGHGAPGLVQNPAMDADPLADRPALPG
jgi:hypothetical protein